MSIRSELTLGIGNFRGNLDRATQEVRQQSAVMRRESAGVGEAMGSSMGGAASTIVARLAPVTAALAAMKAMHGGLKWADDLVDLTEKLQDNAESLQRVDFAARQAASIGVKQVADSMLRLERSLGDVESAAASRALESFGLSARELTAMSLDEKVLALSEAFQKARESGTGLKDLNDLMGRQAADLIPLFNRSGDELREMFAQAPVVADETVQAMAELHDEFQALFLKLGGGFMKFVGRVTEGINQIRDLVSTLSLSEVADRADARFVDAIQDRRRREDGKKAAAEGREREAEMKREEAAARQLAAAMGELEKAMESVSRRDFDLLPEPAQLDALTSELERHLEETVGVFALNFDTTLDGLRQLAQARLDLGDALPTEGQNSAAEAFRWLEEAQRLESEIARRQQSIAEAEAQRLAQAERSRERAEAAEFRLLDPEEQLARLRDRLAAAVSFDGLLDWGEDDVRSQIRALREQGRDDEAAALADTLLDARRLAERIDGTGAGNGGGVAAQGSFASFMDQIFGRGVPEQQLDRLRDIATETRDQKRVLDRILAKMDEPPEPDRFTDFPR